MALAGAHTVHYLCKELEFLAHKVFPLIVRSPPPPLPSAAGRRLVDDATYLKRRAKSNGKLLVIEIVTFASSFSNAHCVRFWGARVSLFAHSNGYAREIMHSAWLATRLPRIGSRMDAAPSALAWALVRQLGRPPGTAMNGHHCVSVRTE